MAGVKFLSHPGEFLHYNTFWIEPAGSFIAVHLGYSEQTGQVDFIFKGMVSRQDLKGQRKDLENYITQIGSPKPDKIPRNFAFSAPRTPVAVNLIGCASRGDWGELAMQQFSHHALANVEKRSEGEENLSGATHGCYISTLELHKAFVYELITSLDEP